MNFGLSEEQRMWRSTVHDFVAKEIKPKAQHVDEHAEFNWDAVRKMGPLGILALNIPEEFTGMGLDALSSAIAIEEIGWGCGSTALAIAAHNGLGWLNFQQAGQEENNAQRESLLTTARTNFQRATAADPENVDAWVGLSGLELELGNWADARVINEAESD